jgi:transcription initiation factor TFIIIB Brf1 subunit/transcription initiation factor TFIIB
LGGLNLALPSTEVLMSSFANVHPTRRTTATTKTTSTLKEWSDRNERNEINERNELKNGKKWKTGRRKNKRRNITDGRLKTEVSLSQFGIVWTINTFARDKQTFFFN